MLFLGDKLNEKSNGVRWGISALNLIKNCDLLLTPDLSKSVRIIGRTYNNANSSQWRCRTRFTWTFVFIIGTFRIAPRYSWVIPNMVLALMNES